MILRTADPREGELRSWLVNRIGATDESALTSWLWSHHKHAFSYLEALEAVVLQTAEAGPSFVHGLMDHVRKPKTQRDLETEIIAWFIPLAKAAAATVVRNGGAPYVAQQEAQQLGAALLEKITGMFPDKHEATLRGAAMTAFTHGSGGFTINAARLSKALLDPDPLPKAY